MKFLLVLIFAVLFLTGLHDLLVLSPYVSMGLINTPFLWGNFVWAVGSLVLSLFIGLLAKSID